MTAAVKKVVHVTDFYPPVIGGLERHVESHAQEQARRGIDVTVITQANPGTPDVETQSGVAIRRLGSTAQRVLSRSYREPTRPFLPPATDPLFSKRIKGVLAELQPDVVHLHGWSAYSALPGRADHATVLTLHDFGHTCAKKTLFRDGQICPGPALTRCAPCLGQSYGKLRGPLIGGALAWSQHLHKRIDVVIALSEAVARACQGSFKSRQISVIPSFLRGLPDAGGLRRQPRPAWLPPEDYVLFVGDTGDHKGFGVLREAAATGLPAPVVVLGRGDDGLPPPPGMVVRHDVPHSEVMTAWAHASIGVVPSIWPEPFGQVAVEALGSGVPLIASDVGALPDILGRQEQYGVLVKPGDAAALRGAIIKLHADAATRAKMARQGPSRAAAFTVGVVADQIAVAYDQAQASYERRRGE